MRIALVITELEPGGAEKCFVHLACFLKSRGHEVFVWLLHPPPTSGRYQLIEQLDIAGISWRSAHFARPWQLLKAVRWLRAELRSFAPDVVQSFLFHANVLSAMAVRKYPWRLFGGARVAQPERWRQLAQRWASKHMQRLVCVSDSVAAHCQQYEKIPTEKLCVIPNGIDLQSLALIGSPCWTELGLPANARVLLFVGRLTPQKGILDFVSRQATAVLEQLPEHQLVLMGAGEQETVIRRTIEALSVAERVHVVGWQATAVTWMKAAELLLLPARYEGMPNVVLEAMALGKPVVSFDVDGVSELLGNSAAAQLQLIQPGVWHEFGEALVRLATNSEAQHRCGQENRQRVEQLFQLEQQMIKYEQLYSQP